MCAECVHLLLAHNAPVKMKNLLGWTPLAEAISYGNRQTSELRHYSFLKSYELWSTVCIYSYSAVDFFSNLGIDSPLGDFNPQLKCTFGGGGLLEDTKQPQMIKHSGYELDTIEQNRGL